MVPSSITLLPFIQIISGVGFPNTVASNVQFCPSSILISSNFETKDGFSGSSLIKTSHSENASPSSLIAKTLKFPESSSSTLYLKRLYSACFKLLSKMKLLSISNSKLSFSQDILGSG